MAQTKTSLANLVLQHLGEGPSPAFFTDIDSSTTKTAKLILNCLDTCRKVVLRAHPWNFAIERAKLQIKSVTNCVNNGSGLIRVTVTSHGFLTGNFVTVEEVQGTYEANGQWTITVIDANNFDLQASAFSNTYASGGFAGLSPAYEFAYKHPLPTLFMRLISIDENPLFEIEGSYIVTDSATLYVKYVKDIYEGVTDYSSMDPQCFLAISLHIAWSICYAVTQSNKLKDELWSAADAIVRRARFVDSTETSIKAFTATEWDDARSGTARQLRDPFY